MTRNQGYYPLPDDVRDDNTINSYIHFHQGNESPLEQDYVHYVRETHPNDADGLYHGEWKNVTEQDRHKAEIENAKKRLEQLEKEERKLKSELKQLVKENNNEQ